MSSGRIIVLVTSLVVAYFLVTAALGAVRSYQLHQREGRLHGEIQELQSATNAWTRCEST